MADKLPIVLSSTGSFQQLQRTDDLDIPLNQRVDKLEEKLRLLVMLLSAQGIELPDELLEIEL